MTLFMFFVTLKYHQSDFQFEILLKSRINCIRKVGTKGLTTIWSLITTDLIMLPASQSAYIYNTVYPL